MNNILTLTKYSFKESMFPYMPKKTVANMPKNYLARILVLIWTYVFLGFLYYGVMKISANLYVGAKSEYMYFTMFAMMVTMMILIFYIPQILSSFFTAKAMSNYQTMPITQGQLFLGKLFGEVVSFFDIFIYFILALIIYFQVAGFDLGILILGIINFFPLIVIPYAIIAIVVLLIKKFTNVNRHARLMKNLGYLLMFALMGIIYWFSFSNSANNGQYGSDIFNPELVNKLFVNISNVFFNSKIFGLAVGGNISQRLIFTGILIATAALISFVGYKLADKYYYDAVFDEHIDTSKKEKQKSKKNIKLEQSSQYRTILKRDLSTIFSNLIFLSSPISMSMIFTIMAITSGKTLIEKLQPGDLVTTSAGLVIFLVSFAIGLMVWINGGIANTSLSREGKSFYMYQTMPIDPLKHMMARYTSSMIISSIFNLIIILILAFILKIGLINTLVAFVGIELAAAIATLVSLYFGTFNISIRWKEAKEIMQGNLKSVALYIASIIIMGLIVGLFVGLVNFTDNLILACLVVLAIIILLVGLIARLCYKSYKLGFMDVG